MANEIKNILIPIDFTKKNHNFLNVAMEVAKRHSAKVHLLNVVRCTLLGTGSALSGKFYYHGNTLIENSKRLLLEEKHKMKAANIEIEVHNLVGSVAASILNKAEELRANLVILGVDYPKKRPGFISSHAYEVISNSAVPVLTVPLGCEKSKFSKLLYPVRDTEGVISKLEVVMPFVRKNTSSVKLFGLASERKEKSIITVNTALKFLNVKMRKQNINAVVQETTLTDHPEDEILNASSYSNADLVAVNVSTGKPFSKLFKNNFTENIIYNSKIPVLFYKKHKKHSSLEKNLTMQYPIMPV